MRYAHLLYVLVLCQVATSLLAGVGESIFMHAPLYLLVPLLRGVLLVVAAVCAGRTSADGATLRRWPLVLLIGSAQLSVFGYTMSTLVGVLPWVSDTVNLAGLLTNLALPLAITALAARTLATWRRPLPRWVPVAVLPTPAPTVPYRGPVRLAYRATVPPRPLSRTLVDPLAPATWAASPHPAGAAAPPVPAGSAAQEPATDDVWSISPVSPPPVPVDPRAAWPSDPTGGTAVTRMLPRDGAR